MCLCFKLFVFTFTDWNVTQAVRHYYMTTEASLRITVWRTVWPGMYRMYNTVRSGFSRYIVPKSSTVLYRNDRDVFVIILWSSQTFIYTDKCLSRRYSSITYFTHLPYSCQPITCINKSINLWSFFWCEPYRITSSFFHFSNLIFTYSPHWLNLYHQVKCKLMISS